MTGALRRRAQTVTVQPEDVVHNAGDTFSLTGKNKWIKDDTDPSKEQRDLSVTADNVVEAVNNDESFVNLSTAHVSYSSSDPAVATVDRDGTVHAVADGTATLKVTVNGVSGTAPVVVKNTLALSAPPLADAGATFTAKTTYTNGATSPVSGVTVALAAPSGWTATASTPATFPQVGAGQAVSTTWRVTVPAGTEPASFSLGSTVTTANGQQSAQAPVTVPYASVSAAYGNSGISDDATPGTGSLDGGGASFSEQTLEAAGYTAGQDATHDGITFPWPATAGTGKPDNIVASGQGVHLTGTGATLGFIGTSDFGAASGSGTILYTDGTTQTYSLGFGDWWGSSPPQGSDFAATLPYLNNSGGHQTQQVHTYGVTVPLKAGKTVESLTLPNVSKTATNGQLALHIFSMAIGG